MPEDESRASAGADAWAVDEDVPIVSMPPGSAAGEERDGAPSASWSDLLAGAGRFVATTAADVAREALGQGARERLDEALVVLRQRLTGDYVVDEFGFDEQFTDVVVANALRPLYQGWFRVEVNGIDNLPSTGGALVVANHSGTFPLDAMMTQQAVLDEHPGHRHLRLLGADLVFGLPLLGEIARASGTTLACTEDATRLLERGELVGVFPEGFKGVGKPFRDRYKLQRFGRGGFVSAAVRTQTPLVPCSIVGAEETYPMLGNAGTLARLLGLPYVPLTPTFPWLGPLGLVPLPSKWVIEFGDPIPTHHLDAASADDPAFVFDLTDQVRETIQQTLYRLLTDRGPAFG